MFRFLVTRKGRRGMTIVGMGIWLIGCTLVALSLGSSLRDGITGSVGAGAIAYGVLKVFCHTVG